MDEEKQDTQPNGDGSLRKITFAEDLCGIIHPLAFGIAILLIPIDMFGLNMGGLPRQAATISIWFYVTGLIPLTIAKVLQSRRGKPTESISGHRLRMTGAALLICSLISAAAVIATVAMRI